MAFRQRQLLAVLLVAFLLAPAASAQAFERTLAGVAQQVTHGWRDDQVPPAELDRRFRSGERLYLTCGTITLLAQRRLRELGVRSRLVVTMTRQPFNANDNGHTLLEVWRGRWMVYDLDNNRVAVDARGRRIDAASLVAAKNRRWRMIADDRRFDTEGLDDPTHTYWIYANLERWYDRVLGVTLLQHQGRYVFGDASQRERLERYSPTYRFVPPSAWRQVRFAPPAP